MPIDKAVLHIISNTLDIPHADIELTAKLTDLVKDSIQLFELLIRLEDGFGKKVSYEDVANIEKVEDIIEFALSRQLQPLFVN